MDAEYLLGLLLRGVLTGRGGRKKTSRTLRYVLGNRRLVGAGVLALGGLAYQLLESMKQGAGPTATPSVPTPATGSVVPPPLPASALAPPTPVAAIPPELLRVIRLSISAASADGVLTAAEREAILAQARAVGAEAMVARDLLDPPKISDLVAGLPAGPVRQQLYAIAYAIVRADEQVADGERAYLQQLAAQLGLGEADVAAIERDASAGISAAGGEGPDSE